MHTKEINLATIIRKLCHITVSMLDNRRHYKMLAITMFSLASSCSNANMLNPDNDIHCSVVSFYFMKLADHIGSGNNEKISLSRINSWYVKRLKIEYGQEYNSNAFLDTKIKPVLEFVKDNPSAAEMPMRMCGERAISGIARNR